MIKNEVIAGSWIGTGLTFLTIHAEDLFWLSFILTIFLNLTALWDRYKPAFLSIGKRLASVLRSLLERLR